MKSRTVSFDFSLPPSFVVYPELKMAAVLILVFVVVEAGKLQMRPLLLENYLVNLLVIVRSCWVIVGGMIDP